MEEKMLPICWSLAPNSLSFLATGDASSTTSLEIVSGAAATGSGVGAATGAGAAAAFVAFLAGAFLAAGAGVGADAVVVLEVLTIFTIHTI
tara:strand:+ start:2415 stop:2687 length:273 start_codon:yes stop_codon:yes gene_type:complete